MTPLEDQRRNHSHSPGRSASRGRGADRVPTALCRDDPFRLLDTHRVVRRLGLVTVMTVIYATARALGLTDSG